MKYVRVASTITNRDLINPMKMQDKIFESFGNDISRQVCHSLVPCLYIFQIQFLLIP